MKILGIIAVVFSVMPAYGDKASSKVPSELTLYTSRKTHLIEPLIKAYEKKAGVKINHINGKAGALIQKLIQEGESTRADLFITVDAGNLWNAAEKGLLAPVQSKVMDKIPAKFKDPKNRWFALSLRARTIFFNNKQVKASDLVSYEGLADERWKGKLCLRTSRKVYNQSLVAAILQRLGEKKTEKMLRGWVKNLGQPVFTSDTQLLKAMDKGQCQVGIANTYYLAKLKVEGKAKNVSVFWPSDKSGGVHVNVSGGGLVKYAKNPKEAQAFLEWLVSPEAQKLFAGLNNEYPVIAGVPLSPTIQAWGEFSTDETPISTIGPNQKRAVLLMDKAKYR